ncbi:MAG: hypothetical protein WD844_14710 [Thermoleophilaceae bacterium]
MDVAAALLIEWKLCLGIAGDAAGDVIARATEEIGEPRLAPTDDLRVWDEQLMGGARAATADELPEVSLPLRLAARIPKRPSMDVFADQAELTSAVAVERAAARVGMTLEAWVLRTLLAGR